MNISLYVKHAEIRRDLEQQNIRIARETGTEIEPPPHRRLPGDAVQLRGIPVVGVKGGLGGAIAGSRPDASLLSDESG